MILRELVRYAERDGLLGASTNFETVPVSWAIQLGRDGSFRGLRPLQQEVTRGKKTVFVGQQRSVPLMKGGKGTSNILARFLVHNAQYVLGAFEDSKNAPRALRCQSAFVALLNDANEATKYPALGSVLSFLADGHGLQAARQALAEQRAASNDLITFEVDGEPGFLDEVPELRNYWDGQMTPADSPAGRSAQCLICGRERPTVRLHSNIKGLRSASPSGVPLVTFNEPAFESYGWSQGANAPVCQSCDRAYVTAINRFLSDRFVRPSAPEVPLPSQQVYLGGSVTAVYWADAGDTAFARVARDADPDDVKRLLESPNRGQRTALDGYFHCLLLQGAKGRATVKSYSSKTVAEVEANVREWFQQTSTPAFDGMGVKHHSQWLMLKQLTPSGKDDKLPKSWVVDLYLSSLFGLPISPAIAQAAITRNRMKAKVNDTRAGLLQAWLARTPMWKERKAIVSLDLECREPAYRLGRVLALCDRIQYLAAERRVGRTLSDSFYSSLSTRPLLALGGLMKITKARAAQLKRGEAGAFIRLGELLPSPEELAGKERLGLKDQALFALGFYHQRAEDMRKKEKETETDDEAAD